MFTRSSFAALTLSVAIVWLIGIAAASAAQSFPHSPPAAQDQGPLRLLDWVGYQIPDFHRSFTKQFPNVKLEYQYANASAEFFAKAATGSVEVDIAHPCANWVAEWKDSGLIAPIDTSRLSHWKELDPGMRKLGYIDGRYWFVPWDWGYESLIVNKDAVKNVPTSWRDLWKPEYKGQISMENFSEGAVHVVAMAYGLPYPDLSDAQLEEVKQKLIELRPNIRTLWSSSSGLVQQMVNHDVSIGYGWNDQYARIANKGVNVTYINPKEGRQGWVCGYVVLKNTKHYDLALKYIDSMIAPESGAAATDKYFLGSANLESVKYADPKTVKALQLDDPDIRKTTHFDMALTRRQRSAFGRIWAEVRVALSQ